MRSLQSLTLVGVIVGSCAIGRADAPFFIGLGDLPGGQFNSGAEAVSADGMVVVGQSNSDAGNEAFLWTQAGGMLGLGDLPGGSYSSEARGVSADGSVIVGFGQSASGQEAFRWAAAEGMIGLGGLPADSFYSVASGVSASGLVIVGYADSGVSTEAIRWTEAEGMVGLGFLPGGMYSQGFAISANGLVITGDSEGICSIGSAFRWTASQGMVWLGDLPGANCSSQGYAASADGSVIVGAASSSAGGQAFRWTASAGMVGLGDLPGGSFGSVSHAVSHDGAVIAGYSSSAVGWEAFIWDETHGMRNLRNVLTGELGLDLNGWTLGYALGVSADGSTIVGSGTNPSGQSEAWIARIPCTSIPGPDCNGNGVRDACDISSGLSVDCQPDGVPDECQIAAQTDCNLNHTPDDCEGLGTPTPAGIIGAVSRKNHVGFGPRGISVNVTGRIQDQNLTSESRNGGITELRVFFHIAPGGPGLCPVSILEQECPGGTPADYRPYMGAANIVGNVEGTELVLSFSPGLENARTYKIEIGPEVTTTPGQWIELRCLNGDVNDDGFVNAADRSAVVGVWTGSGFSNKTDLNLSGQTNAGDRSFVVGAWTGSQSCAP